MEKQQQIALIERIQNKDEKAEEELLKYYESAIIFKVEKGIKGKTEAQKDVIADIFLAVIQAVRRKNFSLRENNDLGAYIHGISINKIKDWYKKQKTIKKYFEKSEYLLAKKITEGSVKRYDFETEEMRALVQKLFSTLNDQYKMVLTLKYFEDRSNKEIAEIMGSDPIRVASILGDAKRKLNRKFPKLKNLSITGLIILMFLLYGGLKTHG